LARRHEHCYSEGTTHVLAIAGPAYGRSDMQLAREKGILAILKDVTMYDLIARKVHREVAVRMGKSFPGGQ